MRLNVAHMVIIKQYPLTRTRSDCVLIQAEEPPNSHVRLIGRRICIVRKVAVVNTEVCCIEDVGSNTVNLAILATGYPVMSSIYDDPWIVKKQVGEYQT